MKHNSINISENDLKINGTELYYCNERNTKFIYSDLKSKDIVGIINLINGKVIEVVNKRTINEQSFYKIIVDEVVVGWINIEDSIRLYRLPKTFGKCNCAREISIQFVGMEKVDESFSNRLIEAKYFGFINDIPSVFIKKIGSSTKIYPILQDDFNHLIIPDQELYVKINEGTSLYKDSALKKETTTVEKDCECLVTGYYDYLNEIRVKINNKSYWLEYKEIIRPTQKYENLDFEFVDKIMYLKIRNQVLKANESHQEHIINTLKNNITISDDLQRIFVNKYIGDPYES